MAHKDLYIVDNSTEDTTVKKYLTDWCSVSKQMDIATGDWWLVSFGYSLAEIR